jgi:hypothetical protein
LQAFKAFLLHVAVPIKAPVTPLNKNDQQYHNTFRHPLLKKILNLLAAGEVLWTGTLSIASF